MLAPQSPEQNVCVLQAFAPQRCTQQMNSRVKPDLGVAQQCGFVEILLHFRALAVPEVPSRADQTFNRPVWRILRIVSGLVLLGRQFSRISSKIDFFDTER